MADGQHGCVSNGGGWETRETGTYIYEKILGDIFTKGDEKRRMSDNEKLAGAANPVFGN